MYGNARASLSAALVAHRGDMIDRLLRTRAPDAALAPAVPLFAPKPAPPPPAVRPPRARLAVRLSHEQLWRLRLAAAYLRQSCQAFLADAAERHVSRIAADPAHAPLGALLAERSGGNG